MKGIKKMSFAAMAALAMVSCSNHDAWMSYEEFQAAQYDAAFVQKYGTIDPNHTWGFGSATTRAITDGYWDGTHTCYEDNLKDELTSLFLAEENLPTTAVNLTDPNLNQNLWFEGIGYIPSSYQEGKTVNCKVTAPATVYIYGKIEDLNLDVHGSGPVTFYNVGEITAFNPNSGEAHVYNAGTMTVTKTANITKLVNGKHLTFADYGNAAFLDSKMTLYSTNAEGATVELPYGGTIESTCDIHGTVNVTGNVNIQTNTDKSICGIVATGKIQNTAGKLVTSYIEANDFYFEGNELYLTSGAHVTAGTIEIVKSGCNVYATKNSVALVEATDFTFQNKNDFTHTFTDNIYFKVKEGGSIEIKGCFKNAHSDGSGQNHTYTDLSKYLANTEDEYHLVAGRLNAGNATGSPACGDEWTIGTPDEEPGEGEKDPDKVPGVQGLTKGRIFCEDLGSTGDFDFNDVVFDAVINDDKSVDIKVWAAGGILDLEVAGVNVHSDAMLGAGIVNTGVAVGKREYAEIHLTAAQAEAMGIKTIEDIPVVVKQNEAAGYNEKILLKNTLGHAPQKICVPLNTKWVKEYEDISDAYPKFKQYVGNSSVGEKAFTEEINAEYLYNK